MSRRVYTPNKSTAKLDEAQKLLYLLKIAIKTEDEAKLEQRINKIRALIEKAKEEMS